MRRRLNKVNAVNIVLDSSLWPNKEKVTNDSTEARTGSDIAIALFPDLSKSKDRMYLQWNHVSVIKQETQ